MRPTLTFRFGSKRGLQKVRVSMLFIIPKNILQFFVVIYFIHSLNDSFYDRWLSGLLPMRRRSIPAVWCLSYRRFHILFFWPFTYHFHVVILIGNILQEVVQLNVIQWRHLLKLCGWSIFIEDLLSVKHEGFVIVMLLVWK